MGLFKRKQKEKDNGLNFAMRLARKQLLNQCRVAIQKAYNGKRLTFDGDMATYIDKEGMSEVCTIDRLSEIFWNKFDNELSNSAGSPYASIALLNITDLDIKDDK